MRPAGDVRRALRQAAQQLGGLQPDGKLRRFNWRQLAEVAKVGWAVARKTVQHMEAAGELVCVDTGKVPGSRRPMNLYVPAELVADAARQAGQASAMASVMATWARG